MYITLNQLLEFLVYECEPNDTFDVSHAHEWLAATFASRDAGRIGLVAEMRNYQDFVPSDLHPYEKVTKEYGDFCLEFDDKVNKLHEKYTPINDEGSPDLEPDGAPNHLVKHQPILTQKQLIEYINILIKGRKPSYVATRAAFDFEQKTFINDDYTTTT